MKLNLNKTIESYLEEEKQSIIKSYREEIKASPELARKMGINNMPYMSPKYFKKENSLKELDEGKEFYKTELIKKEPWFSLVSSPKEISRGVEERVKWKYLLINRVSLGKLLLSSDVYLQKRWESSPEYSRFDLIKFSPFGLYKIGEIEVEVGSAFCKLIIIDHKSLKEFKTPNWVWNIWNVLKFPIKSYIGIERFLGFHNPEPSSTSYLYLLGSFYFFICALTGVLGNLISDSPNILFFIIPFNLLLYVKFYSGALSIHSGKTAREIIMESNITTTKLKSFYKDNGFQNL